MSNPEKPSIKRKQCVGFDMHWSTGNVKVYQPVVYSTDIKQIFKMFESDTML